MTAARNDGGSSKRDPEIARAEAEIARTREAVSQSVVALQKEILGTLDWREWVRQRPVLALALAFGAGTLLGGWRPGFQRRST